MLPLGTLDAKRRVDRLQSKLGKPMSTIILFTNGLAKSHDPSGFHYGFIKHATALLRYRSAYMRWQETTQRSFYVCDGDDRHQYQHRLVALITRLAATLILASLAHAAIGADTRTPEATYELRRSVIGGVHGATQSSPNYSLASTAGEAFANVGGTTGELELESGFWAGSRNAPDIIFKDSFDGGTVPQ